MLLGVPQESTVNCKSDSLNAETTYRRLLSETTRMASGLLTDTVILLADSQEEANAVFVAEYMAGRIRRLGDN